MTKKAPPKTARAEMAFSKLVDKVFATKPPRVTAAYDEAKGRATNAWEHSSEFLITLYSAVAFNKVEPLAKFLESETPLTRSDRIALARFVRSWEAPKLGRPPGPLSGDVNAAERNAVYWVRLGQKKWLANNNRQRVPSSVTNELIADAINVASEAFRLSSKLSSDDIKALVNKASRKIVS